MALMYARQAAGKRVFTGAHMITGTLGGNKIQQVFGLCLSQLWKNRRELEPKPKDTLEKAFNRLNKHNPGFGPFISYEVITDLRHTRYLNGAKDIMMWANPGPGAQRGINRLLGNKVRKTSSNDRKQYPDPHEYIDIMQYVLDTAHGRLPKFVPTMEMRDVEHSLCEWDKHERARLGEGRPRSRYIPPQQV